MQQCGGRSAGGGGGWERAASASERQAETRTPREAVELATIGKGRLAVTELEEGVDADRLAEEVPRLDARPLEAELLGTVRTTGPHVLAEDRDREVLATGSHAGAQVVDPEQVGMTAVEDANTEGDLHRQRELPVVADRGDAGEVRTVNVQNADIEAELPGVTLLGVAGGLELCDLAVLLGLVLGVGRLDERAGRAADHDGARAGHARPRNTFVDGDAGGGGGVGGEQQDGGGEQGALHDDSLLRVMSHGLVPGVGGGGMPRGFDIFVSGKSRLSFLILYFFH